VILRTPAGMMGYCMMQQMTYGIHIRLRARAFIFVSPQDSNQRIVFVNLDLCMTMQSYRTVVLQKLGPYPNS
jgi:neutral ceramidase